MEAHPALVIDNGTRYMKVGHAGEEHPQAIFPTVIGRPRVPTPAYWNSLPGTTTETYPIDRGLVVNWDALEQIWTETFEDKLKVVASEYNVLLTVQAFIQRQHYDKFAEIMFETFNVRGMQIAQQAACGLFGLGCETGLVVNMGDGVTSVVPIYQGIMLGCGVQNLWVGGGDLTDYTMKLLNERNYGLKTIGDRQICQDIKEKHGYVALDFEQELAQQDLGLSWQRADPLGPISLGNEVFSAPEAYFNPGYIGIESAGLPEMIVSSIHKCDPSIRREMFRSIVLVGCSASFPGLKARLDYEIAALLQDTKFNVTIPHFNTHGPKYMAWFGGSVLASVETFKPHWVTNAEYQEHGPKILYYKQL